MANRKRKGMLIKNTNVRPVEIKMANRTIVLHGGDEQLVTAAEVKDDALREKLQVRAVSIVRPSTEEEEEDLKRALMQEYMQQANQWTMGTTEPETKEIVEQKLNILALEPWYGGSHRNFLDGLRAHSSHNFEVISMAARFWKWRMQGGGVTLSRKIIQVLEDGFKPDVIFATDMVNLPAVLSLTRSVLPDVPVILYFHENQLTYPLPEGKPRDYTYAYINYLSCLSADRIVFNSHFHFEEYMEALPVLLRAFPDYTHLHTVKDIRSKSEVIHLGMDLHAHDDHATGYKPHDWRPGMKPPIVLWNQRWEYDKNPEAFFRVMNRLDDIGCAFRLILAGEHFEEQPYEFEKAFERYADRILHYGYAEDFEDYSTMLHRADLVVSTSIHEFFGIAILEAIYCGCHPLLPNRLSYPELVPASLHRPLLHAPILYEDEDDLFHCMVRILNGEERPLPVSTLQQISYHLDWTRHISRFDQMFESVASAHLVA